jgi:adenine-specific DNA-methyltransferase
MNSSYETCSLGSCHFSDLRCGVGRNRHWRISQFASISKAVRFAARRLVGFRQGATCGEKRRVRMNFKKDQSAQKLRGGYYTPPELAEFLARWIGEIKPKAWLEPSCGNGVFFSAMMTVAGSKKAEVLGFELDSGEAAKARSRMSESSCAGAVRSEDFLGWAIKELGEGGRRFDAILGNPPFVRYQYLPPEFQLNSERIFTALKCGFTKHTNAWVPFILASMALLRPGGRLAMVVPAEIIHVTHAQSLRAYLGSQCKRLVVIDPEELWFQDTLQGAVLLLAEKKSAGEKSQGVGLYPVRNREFLQKSPRDIFNAPTPINGKTVQGKWTRALLDIPARGLLNDLEKHAEVHRFDDIASVDVGIVTGANKFFLVDNDTVERFNLSRWAHPMFGRSEHCPGVIYDEGQHRSNAKNGSPTNFLWFDEGAKRDKAVQAYVKVGEEQHLHTRFKCRVRSPWYTVPSVYSTEIGMLKRAHHIPRLILNKAGAYTTDTAYRIRSKVNAERLVASFINPLTALSAELEGRHYGGGVLELVPSEIEKLLIPIHARSRLNLSKLDAAVRSLSTDDLLAGHGREVLKPLGLGGSECARLLESWNKLRNRRQRVSSEELRA